MDNLDSPSIGMDEVIADSEDEGNALDLQNESTAAQALTEAHITQKDTQDTILTGFDTSLSKPTPFSCIDDPTTSFNVPQTRPQTRPIIKTYQTNTDNLPPNDPNPTSTSISNDTEFSNIAERAKMRSRRSKGLIQEPITSISIIELSSDDEDRDSLLRPTKPTRTTPAKSKALAATKTTREEESSSVTTNPTKSRPRPRPRPLGKPKGSTLSDPVTSFSHRLTQDTNVLPMSSLSDGQSPIPFKLISSQLPPSDPPTSTSTQYEHPPIETLPQVTTDPDYHSSPSSLFSMYSNGGKKKDCSAAYVDELDSDQGPNDMNVDPQSIPPPTFFAGSSSPTTRAGAPIASSSRHKESSPLKQPSRKKTRTRKGLVEDEDEDATEKTGEMRPEKLKPKRIRKKKVEVVIEGLEHKGKGKGKVKKKETLKSRGATNDDGDDDMNLFRDAARTNGGPKGIDLFSSLSSLSEPDNDSAMETGPSRKRKLRHRNNVEKVHDAYAEPESRTSPPGKGRRVVVSDDELNASELELSNVAEALGTSLKDLADETKLRNGEVTSTTTTDGIVGDRSLGLNKEREEIIPSEISFKENALSFTAMTPTKNALADPKPRVTSSLTSRYTIAPKSKPTPMSDLIRRVNSKPGSPFCSPAPRPSTPGTAYSPYTKASRKALSRIAPLHPNRRTPPPPLPPPPPKKKTKKELEREEQWEEELVESVGGITEWACMSDAERKELRKAKREREMYGWED